MYPGCNYCFSKGGKIQLQFTLLIELTVTHNSIHPKQVLNSSFTRALPPEPHQCSPTHVLSLCNNAAVVLCICVWFFWCGRCHPGNNPYTTRY